MKIIYKIVLMVCIAGLVSSCFNEKRPNYQYMPNMYESVAYETYAEAAIFRGGIEAQLPPAGTVQRGFVPYEFEDSTAGYEASKGNPSPLDSLSYDEPKAQELYTIYCAICHGDQGNGKGKLVEKEKILGVPAYKDRQITIGSVFHVQTYGLNSMGSYKNQLNVKERWLVSAYVMKLKSQ